MGLLDARQEYKPFQYPFAYEAWEKQQKMHWLPEEVALTDDVRDWREKLTESERHLLTNLFRFFTQGDIDIAGAYLNTYIPVLGKHPEITMMMTSFANMETIHIAAYSHLVSTLGMPDSLYKEFLNHKAMADKHNYLMEIKADDRESIARSLAIYSAFGEGLQLFSSFAVLLNFPRFGKMNGMGQIVTFSVRDESLHVENMTRLFREFIAENYDIWTDELKESINQACRDMVELEDAFIDLMFEHGNIEGLDKNDVKLYIRHIADRRLLQIGLDPIYKQKTNPLGWLEELLNGVEHANFFETRPTEYNKAALKGSFAEDVWA